MSSSKRIWGSVLRLAQRPWSKAPPAGGVRTDAVDPNDPPVVSDDLSASYPSFDEANCTLDRLATAAAFRNRVDAIRRELGDRITLLPPPSPEGDELLQELLATAAGRDFAWDEAEDEQSPTSGIFQKADAASETILAPAVPALRRIA